MQTEYNPLLDPAYNELCEHGREFLRLFMASDPARRRRIIDHITTMDSEGVENPNELRALYGLPALDAPAHQAG